LRFDVVSEFLPGGAAEAMRAAFDAHFADADRHTAAHQIWNYWHVPQMYTYLRTQPEKVLPAPLLDGFHRALRRWAVDHLGFGHVAGPYLSLYVDGCKQSLHNDAENGRFAYVYSLTRWASRRFAGGETILLRDLDYWGTDRCAQAGAGSSFYDLVPPEFNQLLVFDDRGIHGVEPVQGSMDPLEGRVVLHGHIRESGVLVEGALTEQDVLRELREVEPDLVPVLARARETAHGMLSLRVVVSASGVVEEVRPLTVQLSRGGEDGPVVELLLRELRAVLDRARFPAASAATRISLPLPI
jgi:hypothetical protein